MTGFEPRTSGVGSNCSNNWASTTTLENGFAYCVIRKRKNILLINDFKLDSRRIL